MKYLFPGRGVLTPSKPMKLPKAKKLFADLAAAYESRERNNMELKGPAEDLGRAQRVIVQFTRGEPPTPPLDVEEQGMLFRLLSDTWTAAYGGTPKVLTAGKRLADKIVKYWLAAEGPLLAARALEASWSLAPSSGHRVIRHDEPNPEDFDNAFHYLERPLPGFAALQTLRLALATTSEANYNEVVQWARERWEEMPLPAQGALVFLLPTEADLAAEVVDGLECLTGEYWSKSAKLALSTNTERNWPSWTAAVAWSIHDPALFERLNAKAFWSGEKAYWLACLTLAPDKLRSQDTARAVREGILEEFDG